MHANIAPMTFVEVSESSVLPTPSKAGVIEKMPKQARYLVFSSGRFEWVATDCNFVDDIQKAHRFSCAEALTFCQNFNQNKTQNHWYFPIREEDALAVMSEQVDLTTI